MNDPSGHSVWSQLVCGGDSVRILTARQLIKHLEQGLAFLGVSDAPIILWDVEQATDLYTHSIDSRSDAGNLGFYTDSDGDVSIHLANYDNSGGES